MAAKKRKYEKKNLEYWASRVGANINSDNQSGNSQASSNWEPKLISEASTTGGTTAYRSNRITKQPAQHRFSSIDDGLLPYEYSADSVSVRDAIELTQKAYFNFSVFRSTVDMMSEFANSEVYLEGGSERARKFVRAWFKKIELDKLKEQFFREYYRSGNCFFYELTGSLDSATNREFLNSNSSYKIPVKYLLLNPADIVVHGAVSFDGAVYHKTLSDFEVSRLREQKTERDREVFNTLPEEVKKSIMDGYSSGQLYLPLNPEKLNVIFYKKQDYEPLAIPMGYSVLDDINRKEELKKLDQAISRKVEQVILLVTMGAEPDKGGINHNHLNKLQEIFKNQSVGRVLVSDYTTKGEFIVPDLRKVLGEEKYKIINQDILDGLQNMILGESKFADISTKIKIFMRRLNSGRNAFVNYFIQPEIKRICKMVGLRDFPIVKFQKQEVLDDSDLQKLVTRMMELGVITPEQGMESLHRGAFPKAEDMLKEQEKFLKERKEGYYLPLVNSINLHMEEEAKNNPLPVPNTPNSGPKTNPSQQSNSPTPTSKVGPGRPIAANYSAKNIMSVSASISEFNLRAQREFVSVYGKELNEDSEKVLSEIVETIIASKEMDRWDESLKEVVADFNSLLTYDTLPEVYNIANEHQLSDLGAAILYHSNKIDIKP